MSPNIRPESESDCSAITEVNGRAFGGPAEGRLVERLRNTPDFIAELSLVAESDGRVIGHILFHPVVIRAGDTEHPALALAPMSVLPEHQKRGIGSRLVEEGVRRAKQLGHKSVIVLGHPEYYPRFGFRRASLWSIKVPFDAPDEAVMALELETDALQGKGGAVEYPVEFLDG